MTYYIDVFEVLNYNTIVINLDFSSYESIVNYDTLEIVLKLYLKVRSTINQVTVNSLTGSRVLEISDNAGVL